MAGARKPKQENPKVKVLVTYYDIILKKFVHAGDEIEVEEARAKALRDKGLAE